jgi:predicted acylesterase/phospholipase RssA
MLREKRRFNILCLSGGGFRGLYSASLLKHIQSGLGIQRIADHFDLIIGTSTGALVGCAIAAGVPGREIEAAFLRGGRTIFPRRSLIEQWYWLLQMRPRYNSGALAGVIRELVPNLADREIEDIDFKLAIVALSAVSRRHRLFCGYPFADPSVTKTSVLDALLATCAAPTYFRSHAHEVDILIDGGLVANAPVLLGAMLLRERMGAPLDKIHVLHIGTAGSSTPASFEKPWTRHLPFVAWGGRARDTTAGLVDLTISAQESLAVDVASTFLGNRYVYMDVPSTLSQNPELKRLDDASSAVAQKLRMLAERTWLHWMNDPGLHAFFPVKDPLLPQFRPDSKNSRV